MRNFLIGVMWFGMLEMQSARKLDPLDESFPQVEFVASWRKREADSSAALRNGKNSRVAMENGSARQTQIPFGNDKKGVRSGRD